VIAVSGEVNASSIAGGGAPPGRAARGTDASRRAASH